MEMESCRCLRDASSRRPDSSAWMEEVHLTDLPSTSLSTGLYQLSVKKRGGGEISDSREKTN